MDGFGREAYALLLTLGRWDAARRAWRVSGEVMDGLSESGGKWTEAGSQESTSVVNLDIEDEEPMVGSGWQVTR